MKKSIIIIVLIFFCFNSMYSQTEINPKEYPYSYVVKLIMYKKGSVYHGTGVIINGNSIITNAHNVFEKDSIVAYPGYSKNKKDPFGKIIVKCLPNKTVFYPKEFESKTQHQFYDFAVIKYDNPEVYNKILSNSNGEKFVIESVCDIESKTINISGYPYFRWFEFRKPKNAEMHYHNISNKHFLTNKVLLNYKMNTRGGSSGSPLWIEKDDKLIIIGIHKSGKRFKNQGVFYDIKRVELLKKWIEK